MTNPALYLPNDDELGFAYDAAAVKSRRQIAAELLGHTVRRVRYVLLEYRGEKYGNHNGLRNVSDAAELLDPDWRFPGVHGVDFGIEMRLDDGADYFATWDAPGRIESLRLARGDMGAWAGAAWDVTNEEPWSRLREAAISRFDLDYVPWLPEGGFWCPSMSIVAGPVTITIELADIDANGAPVVSADNLTVVYAVDE